MPLQNGRFEKSEIHVAKMTLHMQARFKRHIFFSSLGKKFKAICLFPLIRKLVRVPLPLVWIATGTTYIHKIVKSTNDNLMQDKRQNLIYLDNMLLIPHSLEDEIYTYLPSATSRICNKMQKVCVGKLCRK